MALIYLFFLNNFNIKIIKKKITIHLQEWYQLLGGTDLVRPVFFCFFFFSLFTNVSYGIII